MKYTLKKLKNGLRVVAVPLSNMQSATVTVWVGVGSRYESKEVGGISHFLEHIVFKGSKKRPSAKLISEAIDSFGGEFNASTSKEWTNFYIRARAGKMETAVDVLSDMVLHPLIKAEDVEREKGVIVEEIAMYDDTPIAKIGDYFEQLIFEGNSLGRDIVGSRDTVTKITRDNFVNYRNSHYGSNNVVVTISGGITEKKAFGLAEKYFSDLVTKPKKKFGSFVRKQKKPRVSLHSRKIEQAHLILGFFGNKRMQEDRFAEAVLVSILGGGMSSRMFTEVREKRGLAYAVKTSSDHLIDTGYVSTYAGVDIKRVDEAVKVILDQYYQIADGRYPVTKSEFEKAKEYVKGHLALSLEDTRAINRFFGIKLLLDNKTETPESVFERIDKVTIGEVNKVAKKFFVPEGLNLSLTGPFDSKSRFKKLLS